MRLEQVEDKKPSMLAIALDSCCNVCLGTRIKKDPCETQKYAHRDVGSDVRCFMDDATTFALSMGQCWSWR